MTIDHAREFAQALVDLYEEGPYNGIADEMDFSEIETSNKYYWIVEQARQYLAAHKE